MCNMLRTILAVTLLFAPMSVSFAQEKPAQPVLKVAVMADGRIAVNGAPATIQSLRESLKKLSQQRGVVWYYREAANTEGPPVTKQVVQAITDARLPVRFSSRPDYSDAVGPDGKPIKQ
jgi:predicted transcriptional regulator